jgi:hypothetical protein
MTAAQKLTAEFNAVQEIAAQVKKECGNGMKGQTALIAKWNNTGRYMSFDEAAMMEARNRFYGWGK